jgi:hypothetical protein
MRVDLPDRTDLVGHELRELHVHDTVAANDPVLARIDRSVESEEDVLRELFSALAHRRVVARDLTQQRHQ